MITLEKNDFKKLEEYITKYYEFKKEIDKGNTNMYLNHIVEGFEETYNHSGDIPKQIIHMKWLDSNESDDVICKVLNISKRKLNKIRENILVSFSESMGYA